MEVGKVGVGMLKGSAEQDMTNNQLNAQLGVKNAEIAQNQFQFNKQFAYKQMQDEITARNRNSIANLDLQTRQATPEEKDAYEKEKASRSRAVADALITPAAGIK
jgi:hypothetical protein